MRVRPLPVLSYTNAMGARWDGMQHVAVRAQGFEAVWRHTVYVGQWEG
jgi:hypothetical protein